MDSFQTEPLNLTRIQLNNSVKSTIDLCKDCNSEYCIVKKFQEYQSERILVNPFNRYECISCGKSYTALSTLRNHQRIHAENKSFCCGFCMKSFDVGCDLKAHILTEHKNGKMFECGFCGKIYSRQSSLSAHYRVHKNIEPNFKCNLCGKHFKWKSNLTAHLVWHKNERYVCEFCPRIFETATGLQLHHQNHIKPENKCRYCEKTYSKRFKLNYHIRLKHHSVAPWHCQFCSESFATAPKYRAHIYKIHDTPKPFSCKKCKKSFRTKYQFKVHETTHKKCTYFECDICGHQFMNKRYLYTHMMRRHAQNKGLNNNNNNDSNSNGLIEKLPTQNTFDRNRYFCKECYRGFVYQNDALHCTHNTIYLQTDRNNELNCTNDEIVNKQCERQTQEDGMKVKISLVTENQSNQIIPLYELNIPAVDLTSTTTIDINNSNTMTLDAENQNIEPNVLVQPFTTTLDSTTTINNINFIKQSIPVEVSNQVNSFEAFCDSITPEIIVIDDSSSDEETFSRNLIEKPKPISNHPFYLAHRNFHIERFL